MFLTALIVAHLHYTHLTGITLKPVHDTVVAQLHQPLENGIALHPDRLTIVKTWTE